MQDLLLQLGDSKHLTREKGLETFKSVLDSTFDSALESSEILAILDGMLKDPSWEKQYGALVGYTQLVERNIGDAFSMAVDKADHFLSHSEFRVRVAYGELLGALAFRHGLKFYLQVKPKLFAKIWESFVPDMQPHDSELSSGLAKAGGESWQPLETCMKTLLALMKGLQGQFETEADSELLRCLEQASNHFNRFVREIAHYTLGECYSVLSQNFLCSLASTTIQLTAKGLSDNWSQVRLSASVAARKFIVKMGSRIEDYNPILIPRICLNRYYAAEGVKLYNQETWKLLVGDYGKQKVTEHAFAIVEFYSSQCLSENHTVREAACLCIGELATKVAVISRPEFEPLVPALVTAVLACFKDRSWTVRDASCLASAELVKIFSRESVAYLQELKCLWFSHLSDSVASVRDHAAFAMATGVKAYRGSPEDFLSEVCTYLNTHFLDAVHQRQYETTHAYEDLKEDQPAFSCGSMVPFMRKGSADSEVSKPKQPWEFSDGCVYLIKELIEVGISEVDEQVPRLAELLRLDSFKSSDYLKETVWRQLGLIAKLQGKMKFKRNIEVFFDALFRDLRCKL